MLVSWKWLSELLDLADIVPSNAADRLTFGGLQVEGIVEQSLKLQHVVLGRIVSREQHPQAERLGVCVVDAGVHGQRQIVCGAPNARAGLLAPLALPGAVVAGRTIATAPLRGVESQGMLCSATELGLGGDGAGLLELEGGAPGDAVATVIQQDDVILDISVTPNRGDALSMLGVARDLGALLGRPLRRMSATLPVELGAPAKDRVSLAVEDVAGCPRYAFAIVQGVKVGPSPSWLKLRLEAIGQRSINNIVDVTNWVLFELGQPLHAFDLDQIRGAQIVVRRARLDETLETLDGASRALVESDLVIADAEGPIALAGVMGGAESEISEGTTSVLIECANFDPGRVRATARRLGMRSESSYRFERGVDFDGIPRALARAVELIARTLPEAPCTMAPGFVDEIASPRSPTRIVLPWAMPGRVLGMDVSVETVVSTLTSIGLQVTSGGETLLVEVPAFRPDLTRPIDLVEEVGRLVGYDQIPSLLPPGTPGLDPVRRDDAPVSQQLQPIVSESDLQCTELVRQMLAGQGLSECIHWGFTDPAQQRMMLGEEVELLGLRNPLGSETGVMRRTLLGGLLSSGAYNTSRGQERIALFELGRVFPPESDGDRVVEPDTIAAVLTGSASVGWLGGDVQYSVHDVTGLVERIAQASGRALRVGGDGSAASLRPPMLHPGASASIFCGGRAVGWVGTLHPELCARFGLESSVHAFELDWSAVLAVPQSSYRFERIPRTPGSRRDVALLIAETHDYAAVRAACEDLRDDLLGRVALFDVYRGQGVATGYRSLALRFEYRDRSGSLTDGAVDVAHSRLVGELCDKLGATIR